jgi:hypothetical protein
MVHPAWLDGWEPHIGRHRVFFSISLLYAHLHDYTIIVFCTTGTRMRMCNVSHQHFQARNRALRRRLVRRLFIAGFCLIYAFFTL